MAAVIEPRRTTCNPLYATAEIEHAPVSLQRTLWWACSLCELVPPYSAGSTLQ